jgi:hypothetical protein
LSLISIWDHVFKFLNMVVDVAVKLLIDNVEFVGELFKLLKIVVDVACKLFIDDVVLGPRMAQPTFKDYKIVTVAMLDIKLYEFIS